VWTDDILLQVMCSVEDGMILMEILYVSVHNEWQLMKPLGRPPSKRRRQSCLIVGDKLFLFGGTSPLSVPNPNGIQDIAIDDNLQGLDAKLMDHSDLHVLDFGIFLSFYLSLPGYSIVSTVIPSPLQMLNHMVDFHETLYVHNLTKGPLLHFI